MFWMNDLNKRQIASVNSFKKVDGKEKHFAYITFGDCNAVTRFHRIYPRYRRVSMQEWQRALGVSPEICMVQDRAPGLQLIKIQASKGRRSRLNF